MNELPEGRTLNYPPVAARREYGLSLADQKVRVHTLGASEIAAVAGVHPYHNALDVYLSKINAPSIVTESDVELEEYSEWGHRLEPMIAQKYSDFMGVSLIMGERRVHPVEQWMSATPDRLVIRDWSVQFSDTERIDRGLELKNRNAHVSGFGEAGSDIVPFDIAAQCHWSMEVWKLEVWDIAVLIGGNRWSWYRIERDQEIIDSLRDRGYDFWHNNVLARIEPSIDGSESWKRYITQKFAKHSEVLREGEAADFYVFNDLVEVKARLKELEPQKTQLENMLKAQIGEAAGISWPNGAKITWKRTKDSTAEVIDYQAIAMELATQLNLSLADQQSLREQNTTTVVTREGVRKLYLSMPKVK